MADDAGAANRPPHAPFIPAHADEVPMPNAPWRVFGTKSFFKLWLAQVTSSMGDWIGLIAILAIAARVSDNSGAAVSLVMVARVVPGFFLATVGGVIVDRFDRRKVMVLCDIGRASLLALLPFVDTLAGLVVFSFLIEILTLLWSPAKDATVPNLVEPDQLASANSLGLVAAYGTFPIASVVFSFLSLLAVWLGRIDALSNLAVDREVLALWVDVLTFLTSAAIVWTLPIPRPERKAGKKRVDWTETFRDIREGFKFISSHSLVRAIIIGLGAGLIGGGAMIPLGPAFASEVLDPLNAGAAFGVLMTALGFGAASGVVTLLWVQKRLPRETVFTFGVMGTGLFLIIAVCFSNLAPAAFFIGATGACAGATYVTGFTVLQESVEDEMRGRTFATLYSVIRLCLLVSLTVSPLLADLYDWMSDHLFSHRAVEFLGLSYALPGVRFALWTGGFICLAAGLVSRHLLRSAQRPVGEAPEALSDPVPDVRPEPPRDVAPEGGT